MNHEETDKSTLDQFWTLQSPCHAYHMSEGMWRNRNSHVLERMQNGTATLDGSLIVY